MFADVILPLNLKQLYTYAVPVEFLDAVKVGKRIEVQFGKRRIYSALIYSIHSNQPKANQPKAILNILDDKSIVNEAQLKLWEWIAHYYMCSMGDVMNAALPGGLKLNSETKVIIDTNWNKSYEGFSDDEYLIAEALSIRKVLTLEEIREILNKKSVLSLINNLMKKQILYVEEELKEKYKPAYKQYLKLNDQYKTERQLKQLFEDLKKAPKQIALMMKFLQLKQEAVIKQQSFEISRTKFLKQSGFSATILSALEKKNVFDIYKKVHDRTKNEVSENTGKIELSLPQKEAIKKIESIYETLPVCLLQGVTSSGKTQIYIHLIEQEIAKGNQVLYLLPEIALTTQITDKLQSVFGEQIGVYHSRFSSNERVEIWNKVLHKKYKIILGARSALFLPFDQLSLIVVDEEHDSSFKQFDPAPRYNARDTAIYLAGLFKAKVLLGSATPCLESKFNADIGKYGYVVMSERYGSIQMPEMQVVNLKEAKHKKQMKSLFSNVLIEGIKETLNQKQQIILFQNRRGYAPFLECATCGWVPYCKNCDVSLTYYKYSNELKCHYCGFRIKTVEKCDACGGNHIQQQSFGTEKIEDELNILFPKVNIARMDLDAVRKKDGHRKIIRSFEEEEIDILVGTQMVTKGLDFENVGLVGIISADHLFNHPDFRANERAMQLIMQVSGRTGRKNKRGKVLIQAMAPRHPVLLYCLNNNYDEFYLNELKQRKQFKYPPYYRLIKIIFKHKKKEAVYKSSITATSLLKKTLGARVIGPSEPLISKVRNNYLQEVLIKIAREKDSPEKIKQIILKTLDEIKQHDRALFINIDVDPY